MSQDCVDSVSRELEAEMFCYLDLQKSHICDKKGRMQTFPNYWYNQENATSHELVDAGFYCMGSGDRTSCFYCGGQFFTGNCVTIRGTGMQIDFLCVSLF